MQIAQVLGDYTLGGADILRKAMGKKDPEEMARQGAKFTAGAAARGIDDKLAQSIFDLMEKFAGYGFNKSHSAAYALVSYQTAWLKTHYPAYFMAAVLSADMQNTDKIVTLIDECRDMGLTIVPPDVNVGEYNFTVNDNGEIVYGLGAIKGLGAGPIEAMIEARLKQPFETLLDLCQRVDGQLLNKRSLETLIKSGSLDRLMEGDRHYVRAWFAATLADAMRAAEQSNRNQASGVDDLFGNIAPTAPPQAAAGKHQLQVRPWGEQHLLAAEKESLGLFLSGHPYNEYRKELKAIVKTPIARLRPQRGNRLVAGLLYGVRTMKSKSGDTIAFLTLDDCSGRLEVSLFAKEFEQYRDHLQKDAILVVDCSLSVDDYT
ncbi:MAG: OB-fold nucleic acid binding domain-containing protein, partial [Gammaproteobacteria bacterium]